MNKNISISKLEFAILLTYPLITTFNYISYKNILTISKIDSYLSIIYAFILGIIPLLLFIYIFNYKPELSLPNKNIKIFGKILGTIINYITTFIVSILGIIILYNTTNFIILNYLKETPKIIIILAIGLTIVFNISKGIEAIARTSFLIFIIIIILTICSTIGLITKFNIENILPILNNNINNVIISGNTIFINNILPIYMLLIIPKNYINKPKNINKYIFLSYFFSFLLIFIICYLTIGILGINLINIYSHPEYIILKKISIMNFIDRIENIVYLKWLFNSLITLILITYFITNSIKTKDKINHITTIIILIITTIIIITSKKTINLNAFISKNYYIFNIVFILIIIITSINIFIRKQIKKEA